jgi:hypothetical protein
MEEMNRRFWVSFFHNDKVCFLFGLGGFLGWKGVGQGLDRLF